MSLKRTLIFLGVVAASVGVLVVGGGALVLSHPAVKQKLADELSKAAKMPIECHSVAYVPGRGLLIRGVRVPAPDADEVIPFLATERISVQARLLPLLQRKLIVDELRIEAASMNWRQDDNGRFVLPGTKKAEKVESPAPILEVKPHKELEKPFVLETRHVRLIDGHLLLRDRKGKAVAEFSGLDFRGAPAGARSFGGTASVGEVSLHGGDAVASAVKIPFSYTPEGLEMSGITGDLSGGQITGTVYVATGEDGTPLKANIGLRGIDMARLLRATGNDALALGGRLTGRVEYAGSFAQPASRRGTGSLEIENGVMSQNPVLAAAGMLLNIPELVSLELKTARLSFEIKGETVEVQELILASDTVRLTASGKVKKEQKLDLDARLALENSLLKKLPSEIRSNFAASEDLPGWAGVDFDVKGTLSKPKSNLEDRLVGGSIGNIVFDILGLDTKAKPPDSEQETPPRTPGPADAEPER